MKAWLRLFLIALLLLWALPSAALADGAPDLCRDAAEVYELIRNFHVHPDGIKPGSIDEMLKQLGDPYTQYFTEEEYRKFMTEVDGSYTGIGLFVQEEEGYTVITRPIEGSPAERAGLKAGDKILAVDGQNVVGLPMEAITSRIKGPEGTPVRLTILRNGEVLQFTLIRETIQLPLVAYELLDGGTGYIQIVSFGENTAEKVKEAIEKLKDQGMTRLILDVRGNPGGRLQTVLEIAGFFVPEKPVVWVKNNQGRLTPLQATQPHLWDKPVILLVDRYSASASEILAAALKEHGKALIIGETTFGKGTVQSLIPLSSGSVLKLTTQEYFSPNLNKIDGIGVKPHVTVPSPEEQTLIALEWANGIDQVTLSSDGSFHLDGKPIQSHQDIAVWDRKWYLSLYRLQLMFGGDLDWNAKTRTATYRYGDQTIQFTLGKDPVKIINDRMYVPLELLRDLEIIAKDERGNWIVRQP